ncbi:hypothetical protein ACFP6A_08585 [Quadrisphaera sp. GCM10027208]|uniref:hypothetical protein n=1 Tax=Quadrisphaera sp. GCM10027208 TaxID=3273423 RepID=UPI003619BF7E
MGTSIRGLLSVATSAAEIAGAGLRQVAKTLTEGSGEEALGGVQRMRDMVRSEVQRSIGQLGGVSPAEVADLRHRVAVLEGLLAAAEERTEQPQPERPGQPARRAAKKATPGRTAKKAAARPAPRRPASRRQAPASSVPAEGSRPVASVGPDTSTTVADVAEVSPLDEG